MKRLLKVAEANTIKPVAGKFLVEKLKERMYTRDQAVPADPDAIKEDKETETKVIKVKQPYYVQYFKVLAIPKGEDEFIVGDIILSAYTGGVEFDLIKGTKLLNRFDILGKYTELV